MTGSFAHLHTYVHLYMYMYICMHNEESTFVYSFVHISAACPQFATCGFPVLPPWAAQAWKSKSARTRRRLRPAKRCDSLPPVVLGGSVEPSVGPIYRLWVSKKALFTYLEPERKHSRGFGAGPYACKEDIEEE